MKKNLPIVNAVTAVELPSGEVIILKIYDGVYNKDSTFSQISDYKIRGYVEDLDAVPTLHGGR